MARLDAHEANKCALHFCFVNQAHQQAAGTNERSLELHPVHVNCNLASGPPIGRARGHLFARWLTALGLAKRDGR